MILVLGFLFSVRAYAATEVPIVFIEALAPRDSTSSEKFKKDFEESIALGKSFLDAELKKCNYHFETKTKFYDASDALQAKELAANEEKHGVWILVGPRRSNHYIAMVKGSQSTPSISLMAGSSEVEALGLLHVTLSPFNIQMAAVATKEALRRTGKNKTYISIVNSDCLTCVDFADRFNQNAHKLGLKLKQEIKISGEEPDVTAYADKIKGLNAGFILLPNFSKSSVKVMNVLDKSFNGFYVGADGWGDSKFGFVQKGARSDLVSGFTVRGLPPVINGLAELDLGKKILRVSDTNQYPQGGPAMAALKIMDWTKKLLCTGRPKSKLEFIKLFQSHSKSINAPWGVSIYNLKNGEIIFDRKILGK